MKITLLLGWQFNFFTFISNFNLKVNKLSDIFWNIFSHNFLFTLPPLLFCFYCCYYWWVFYWLFHFWVLSILKADASLLSNCLQASTNYNEVHSGFVQGRHFDKIGLLVELYWKQIWAKYRLLTKYLCYNTKVSTNIIERLFCFFLFAC